MPMGIVSDDDFEAELARLGIPKSSDGTKHKHSPDGIQPIPTDTSVLPAIVEDIKKGRGDSKNVPDIIRETVARAAINGEGSGEAIAKAFGVSESSVSAYKVGATSTASYNEPDDNLLSTVTGHRKNIAKGARETLMAALENLTSDKLAGVKAKELSSIAKDMSSIIVDMEPPLPANIGNQNNVQFVFMAPRVRSEDSYEIREVND